MEIGGGWRAALYLQNGDVDWGLDVTLWPKDDQVGLSSIRRLFFSFKLMNFAAKHSARNEDQA